MLFLMYTGTSTSTSVRKSYRGTNKGKSLGLHGQIITAGEEAVDYSAAEDEENRMNVVVEDDSLAQLRLMVAGNAGLVLFYL